MECIVLLVIFVLIPAIIFPQRIWTSLMVGAVTAIVGLILFAVVMVLLPKDTRTSFWDTVRPIFYDSTSSPAIISIVFIGLSLLFATARTYRVKAIRLLWVGVFASVLSGFAYFIHVNTDNAELDTMVSGLPFSTLMLIPLAMLAWRVEIWPSAVAFTLLASFFIVPIHFRAYPSVYDTIHPISELAIKLVPAMMASMVVVNFVESRHDSHLIGGLRNPLKGHRRPWSQRIVRFFGQLIVTGGILGAGAAFVMSLYWVTEQDAAVVEALVQANLPYILLVLFVLTANWLSLKAQVDDLPLIVGASIIGIASLLLAELAKDEFLRNCGVEGLGGVVTFGLTFVGSRYQLQKATILMLAPVVAGLIVIPFPGLASELYYGLLSSILISFAQFAVIYQMESEASARVGTPSLRPELDAALDLQIAG